MAYQVKLRCPFCNNDYATTNSDDDVAFVISDWPCLKCAKIIKNSVSFVCDTCHRINVVDLKKVRQINKDVKPWDKFKTYKCPNCNNWTFIFTKPN